MATRRPRVKPTAILKSRRPQSAQRSESTASTSLKVELSDEIGDDIDASLDGSGETAAESLEMKTDLQSLNQTDASDSNRNSIEAKPDIGEDAKVHASNNVPVVKSFRRMITPSVNIVSRRKFPTENLPFNLASPVHGARSPGHMCSPAHMKSPAYSFMYENTAAASPRKIDEKPISSPKIGATNEDEVFSPAPENDDCFKSPPFMSPSIYSRRTDMSPYTDGFSGDDSKAHGPTLANVSNKIRQRIRPTPCFNRRNSIQGVAESDDDSGRRQRHYSTSSTYSTNYNPGSTPQQHTQRNYFGLNKTYSRIRTESVCSNLSDATSMRDINMRPKRMHRSEEFQRVANAKREFNQRLNGKTPDKSRLTMYDMIYYNPVSNPMSRPAVKSEMKDRNDSSSVSSIRTIESRHSVKCEPKVKAENTDSNQDAMPVPQLKLGPNGEIILDEKSLIIETTGNKEAREMLANSDIVYDDEFSGTSGFYKRHKRTKDWSAEETIKFYRSLQAVGTDFSVMLQLFPNRSRRDLKLKFKKEERHNMALINKALLHPKEFNVDELMEQFEKEDRDKEAKKAEWADLAQKMSRDRKEQLNVIKKRSAKGIVSASARCLTDGDKLYENEFVKMPKHRKMHSATWSNGLESEQQMLENSPIPISPFTQPSISSTPIRSPTYATHKLPSFNEMISSHKASSFNANNNNINNNNHLVVSESKESELASTTTENAQSTNLIVIPNDDELPMPATATSTPIACIATVSESNDITVTEDPVAQSSSSFNGTVVHPYIAEDPNLAYKSNDTDDIMNMDIIFDNMPIEADPTIGSNVTIIDTMATPATATDPIRYEIIDLDGANRIDTEAEHQFSGTNYSQIDDSSNDGILVIDETVHTPIDYNEIILESNDVVIVSSPPPSASPKHDLVVAVPGDQPNADGMICPETTTTSNVPNLIKTKQTRVRQMKPTQSKSKAAANNQEKPSTKVCDGNESVAGGSSALLKRKRKPLPTLIGRNKRSKTEDSPPIFKSDIDAGSETIVSNECENDAAAPSTSAQFCEQATHSTSIDKATDEQIPKNESNESEANNFMDSLVVVESQDPNDANKTIHEVYVMCPETKQISDQPLDLPDEVIQRIRLSMLSGAE